MLHRSTLCVGIIPACKSVLHGEWLNTPERCEAGNIWNSYSHKLHAAGKAKSSAQRVLLTAALSKVRRAECRIARVVWSSAGRLEGPWSLVSSPPPPPSILSERCSLAVVVAAVTAASLTAAKKSESCAWVTAELCWCTRYVGVALTAEASHSTLISKCQ